MGINISANPSFLLNFFSLLFFFFKANMNLTVFAGILFCLTTVTARRASLGEKTMQAAAKADEPDTMRKAARPASLVEKIKQAADEPDEPKREADDCGWAKQLACDFGSKAACIECGKRDDEARDEAALLEKLTA